MKIKENYRVREIAGENLIVEQGKSQADMTKVISLNNTAVLLWRELQGSDFSLEDVAHILMNHYSIPKEQALIDAQKWVDALSGCGIIG
ncbi:PqqD family protein [uncultured Bacteroides sp.]|uniref:PqqD family protein n=1 Tax=uncultured Bacteroides sp. TaxID=162156 RepID=UPI0025E616EA|nr:PqqD family protein [uncultured Bacteroides sp.]